MQWGGGGRGLASRLARYRHVFLQAFYFILLFYFCPELEPTFLACHGIGLTAAFPAPRLLFALQQNPLGPRSFPGAGSGARSPQVPGGRGCSELFALPPPRPPPSSDGPTDAIGGCVTLPPPRGGFSFPAGEAGLVLPGPTAPTSSSR